MFNRNTQVDTRVAILEEKFSVYEQMMNKMESAIHTISEAYQGISKMLAIHEEKIESGGNSDNIIIQSIRDMEKRNTDDHNRVITEIEKIEKKFEDRVKDQDEKIEGLVKFRLLVGGAIILIGFLFTQQQIRFLDYLLPPSPPAIVKPGK